MASRAGRVSGSPNGPGQSRGSIGAEGRRRRPFPGLHVCGVAIKEGAAGRPDLLEFVCKAALVLGEVHRPVARIPVPEVRRELPGDETCSGFAERHAYGVALVLPGTIDVVAQQFADAFRQEASRPTR